MASFHSLVFFGWGCEWQPSIFNLYKSWSRRSAHAPCGLQTRSAFKGFTISIHCGTASANGCLEVDTCQALGGRWLGFTKNSTEEGKTRHVYMRIVPCASKFPGDFSLTNNFTSKTETCRTKVTKQYQQSLQADQLRVLLSSQILHSLKQSEHLWF